MKTPELAFSLTWISLRGMLRRMPRASSALRPPWLALVLLGGLLFAQASEPEPVVPQIGPPSFTDLPVRLAASTEQGHPVVVTGGAVSLAVWEDYRKGDGTPFLMAARISQQGENLDPDGFQVCLAYSGQYAPSVAYDGERYVVAWSDDRNALISGLDVYFARVTVEGWVLDPEGIVVNQDPQDQVWPLIAADAGMALCAWRQAGGEGEGTNTLRCTRLTTDGQVLDAVPLTLENSLSPGQSVAVAAVGDRFAVVWQSGTEVWSAQLSTNVALSPAVPVLVTAKAAPSAVPALGRTQNQFLLSWADEGGQGGVELRAAFLREHGPDLSGIARMPLTNSGIAHLNVVGTGAYGLLLWTESAAAEAQAVTRGTVLGLDDGVYPILSLLNTNLGLNMFQATGNQGDTLLCVGTRGAFSQSDVWANRFTLQSFQAGTAFPFLLSGEPNAETSPAVAWNGSHYLVVWQDDRDRTVSGGNIYGIRLALDGTPLDRWAIPVCMAPGDQSRPAVAVSGEDFLVTWTDGRNPETGSDIYAARVNSAGEVSDQKGFLVCGAVGQQYDPAVAGGPEGWMTVWTHMNEDGSTNLGIYGTWVDSGGKSTHPGGIPIALGGTGHNSPTVASSGSRWLVVWQDGRDLLSSGINIYGRLLEQRDTVDAPPDFPLSMAADNQHLPTVAGLTAGFLAVWWDERNGAETGVDVYSTKIGLDRMVQPVEGTGVATTASSSFYPALALGPEWALAVWDEYRTQGQVGFNVYGQLLGLDGVPVGARLPLNTNILDQSRARAASDDRHGFLAVYETTLDGRSRIASTTVQLPPPPQPVLQIELQPQALKLAWNSVVGRTYTLERCSSLLAADWSPLISLAGDGGFLTFADPLNDGVAWFYRVRHVPSVIGMERKRHE
jgi:hypothetical protein